jgi:predicted DNA-binding ribbon-helix-helix protein
MKKVRVKRGTGLKAAYALRVTNGTLKALKGIAKKRSITVSLLINNIVSKYIEKYQ